MPTTEIKFYDYLNASWEIYNRRIVDMTESEAKRFVPQRPREQNILRETIASGQNIGVACLLVLSDGCRE